MELNNYKKTALYDEHLKRGGKIVEFGGYLLPVEYTGIANEHFSVRENVGMFDVSHMGEIFVTGEKASEFLNYVLTCNSLKQNEYRMQYGLLLYNNGTFVDDLMIYKYNNQKFLIVANASNTEKDYLWLCDCLSKYIKNNDLDIDDVKIENKSDLYGQIALQGPNAYKILNSLSNIDFNQIKMYDFIECEINGHMMIISRSGYTGGDGFEIYGFNKDIVNLFCLLNDNYNVTLCGLGCRDTLRFEGALPLYGHEISDQINPIMAGLNFACDYTKEFIGKESLLEYKQNQTKKLVGIELLDKGIARSEYEVLNKDEEVIGYITTGYMIPGYNNSLAMALIDINYSKINTEVFVRIRKKLAKAVVRDKKFMNKKYIK